MAKRYTRINWQNKPNTATPISAENLNKMDKGIKDCDDAIGDLALLSTNNKTDLVAAINELKKVINTLNNNLADKIGTQKYYKGYVVLTQMELDNILNNPITTFNAQDNILYEMLVFIDVVGLTLPAGANHIIGMHYGDGLYGYQIAISYTGAIKQRNCHNGVWTTWVDK